MKLKILNRILVLCAFAALTPKPLFAAQRLQQLDYADALQTLDNPGRGFYRTCQLHLAVSGSKPINTWGNLVHLRVDIGEFSSNAFLSVDKATGDTLWGKSQLLTDDALNALDATLAGIRERGKTAVVRVCYDPWYNGRSKPEPSDQNLVLEHIRQIAKVYSRHTDVISYIELGMYGPWGEMHTSSLGTNANIAQALQTMLQNTPGCLKVGVRRPDIVATWMGLKKADFSVGGAAFEAAAAAKGDTMYRVGLFNDGYLGSSSDLGTIDGTLNREMMVSWLESYSQHTLYGGELVANYNGNNPINTPAYLSGEGFRTHTAYLNYEWHQPTILGWKDSVFTGGDAEYEGVDGYTYVDNHLGYRFVLRESLLTDTVTDGRLHMNLKVQNVGFGNVCSEKELTVLLIGDDKVVELEPTTAFDVRQLQSRQTIAGAEAYDGTSLVELDAVLPDSLPVGNYRAYVRISQEGDFTTDKNYQCIRFANADEQYNEKYGANLVGDFYLNPTEQTSATMVGTTLAKWWQNGENVYTVGMKKIAVYSVDGRLLNVCNVADFQPVYVGRQRVIVVER